MWSTVTLKKETLELSVFQEWVGLHLVRGVVEDGVPPKGTGMSEGLEIKDIKTCFVWILFGGGRCCGLCVWLGFSFFGHTTFHVGS